MEVERDPSLPNNSLVDGTSSPKISREVRLKEMEVRLEQNFMARVSDRHIQHSRELLLRKKLAKQEEDISILVYVLRSVIGQ